LPATGDAWTYSAGWNWTLLDQFSSTRQPQESQVIGGTGQVARTGNVSTTWDVTQALYNAAGAASSGGVTGNGAAQSQYVVMLTNPANDANGAPDPAYPPPTVAGPATLVTLAAGWTSP
jgi:hypothetical protein